MSKKLLSEAEMRRFMGLAGIRPPAIKTRIQETYGGPVTERDEMKKEEYAMPEEMGGAPMEDMDEKPEMDMEVDEPEMMDQPEDMPAPADDALDALSDEMKEELFSAVASAAAEVLDLDVEMEMGDAGDAEDAPEMADVPEMPDAEEAPEMEAEEEEEEEVEMPLEEETTTLEEEEEATLEEENVSLQLSEEEIVNEVARRVAKRLVKASKANKTLKEALGRK